jgi:beta-lactamase class D
MHVDRVRQVRLARCRSARRLGAAALLALACCPAMWQGGCASEAGVLGRPAAVVAPVEEVRLGGAFADLDATFVVRVASTGRTLAHRPERAATRMVPASTFKIPISIAALENGVADGAEFAIAWDAKKYPLSDEAPESWRQDLTLRSAFANSSEWFYRELVRRIGTDRMSEWTVRLGFGAFENGSGVPAGDTGRFWLDGRLRISAIEQVDFIERFVRDELPIADATTRTMRSIMLLDEVRNDDGSTTRLFGKTGTSAPDGGTPLGWLVGFVEHRGETLFFALNISHERLLEDFGRARRAELVMEAIVQLKLVP